MLRTQISLTEDDRQLLDAEAARTGQSVAALIRTAVHHTYGPSRDAAAQLETMRSAYGAWEQGADGAATVDALRSGRRLHP